MFRFKNDLADEANIENEFQYILCFGSSDLFNISKAVTIMFQYILCFGSRIKGGLV